MAKAIRFLSAHIPPYVTPPPTSPDLILPPDYTLAPFTMPITLPPAVRIPDFNFNFSNANPELGAGAAAVLATFLMIITYITHCLACTPCIVKKAYKHKSKRNLRLTSFSSS